MTPPKFSVVNQSVHWTYVQGMGASMKGPSSIDDDSQGTASMNLPASTDLMDPPCSGSTEDGPPVP